MARLVLNPGIERRLKNVYLWIFNNQIDRIEDLQTNGDLVEIISSKDRPVGIGYFNRHSLIAGRVLSFQTETIDQAFFHRRISRAISAPGRGSPDTSRKASSRERGSITGVNSAKMSRIVRDSRW